MSVFLPHLIELNCWGAATLLFSEFNVDPNRRDTDLEGGNKKGKKKGKKMWDIALHGAKDGGSSQPDVNENEAWVDWARML